MQVQSGMTLLSDNAKKALIIGPSAILPRPLRVPLRRRLLGKLEVDIARRSQLLIITHPKSGNTWLKVMLTRLYGIRHGIAPEDFAKYPALADRNPAIPRFAATNGWYSYERAVGDQLTPQAPDAIQQPTVEALPNGRERSDGGWPHGIHSRPGNFRE